MADCWALGATGVNSRAFLRLVRRTIDDHDVSCYGQRSAVRSAFMALYRATKQECVINCQYNHKNRRGARARLQNVGALYVFTDASLTDTDSLRSSCSVEGRSE